MPKHASSTVPSWPSCSGRKLWTVCDVPSWLAPNKQPADILESSNASCVNVTLQGGDVMYLPFGTLHRASTDVDLSMHLTVNLERQFYVWHALFLAMIHKALRPELRVRKFASSEDFIPDDRDIPLVGLLAELAAFVPEMYRLPGFSFVQNTSTARLLLTSLCNEDLPEAYLGLVAQEFQDLTTRLEAAAAASSSSKAQLRLGGKSASLLEALKLLKTSTSALPWALQLARFHAMKHFSLLAKPHLLLSLSAVRSKDPDPLNGLPLSKLPSLLGNATLARAPKLRAVLLQEAAAKLVVNGEAFTVQAEEVEAARFCLGLFAQNSSRGQPFSLADVPGDPSKLIPKLVTFGALQLL